MTRVALDSNILIYAELEPESVKGRRAAELILLSARDGVIAIQVLGEYLRFVQRRAPGAFDDALRQSEVYKATFLTPATTTEVFAAATVLASDHKLQLWDGVVCAASSQAGAKVLLSEDMQDGRMLGTMRIVNPFAQSNVNAIEYLLGET